MQKLSSCNFLIYFCGFELWVQLLFLLHLSFAACLRFLFAAQWAAMAGNIALPLQEFIASLESTSLPKILQVCSGVYFQGKQFLFFLLVGNSTDIVWVQGLNNQELSHEIRLDSIVSGCLNKCKSFANLYVSMFSSVTSRSLVTVAKYDSQEFVAVLNSCPWVSRGKKISQKQL